MMTRCLGCMSKSEMQDGVCPLCSYKTGTPVENSLHMQPGTMLLGRFLIGKVIGYGGFGVTYIGWDSTLQQRVAIKEYLPSEFATRAMGQTHITVFGGNKAAQFSSGMAKFIDEARRLAQFQGEEGIVRVYDSFETNNTAYIIMEYLDGETLTSFLNREGNIPVEKAITMLTPVIHSLEIIHKAGIIHRDIAPDNIMITEDGRVKLIDFGAARYATTSHSRSLTVIIKPGYSPEEQYRSRGDQGPYTDVYSLGAVLYRMVTGETPPDALERRAFFENKKKDILVPPSKRCKISKNVENALLNAMNIRIEDRTPNAEVFLAQLTSEAPVQRIMGKIKAIDLMKWPLWAKITIPACGVVVTALLVLLLTGKIGFANNLITTLTLGEGMTRVPSVINYSVSSAQEKLDGQELVPIISGREASDTIPANMVLRQSITAGKVVEKNSQIELFISAPVEPIAEDRKMPDIAYYTQVEATDILTQLGAIVSVELEYSNDVAAGIVIRASIGVNEPLAAGDEITLYVSQGPDPSANTTDPDNPDVTPDDASGVSPQSAPTVSLNRSTLSLLIGESASLTASGGNGSYSWSSSNTGIVTVNNGSISAVGKGSATISVSSGNSTTTCSVIVYDTIGVKITGAKLASVENSKLSLIYHQNDWLIADVAPKNISILWKSSNPNVVSVTATSDTEAIIFAAGGGTALITAEISYGGKKYTDSYEVTVVVPHIELSESSLELKVGESHALNVSYSPDYAKVKWFAGDAVVVDENGVVTAVKPGNPIVWATIEFRGSEWSANCHVTVTE